MSRPEIASTGRHGTRPGAKSTARYTVTPAGSIDAQGPQVFVRLDGAYDDLQRIADTPIVAGGLARQVELIRLIGRLELEAL